MSHELPKLPYSQDALAPHISAETLEFHYGKHHAAYVANLNNLVSGTKFEGKSLEDVIKEAPAGGVFNNAAQIWNHTFYFSGLGPNGGGEASGVLAEAINAAFGSFASFREAFTKAAATNFGSGWTWLVKNPDGSLDIVTTSNADTVITGSNTPVLTIDVWEHAYYVDKRNARPAYIESWWNVVDWSVAAERFGA